MSLYTGILLVVQSLLLCDMETIQKRHAEELSRVIAALCSQMYRRSGNFRVVKFLGVLFSCKKFCGLGVPTKKFLTDKFYDSPRSQAQ